MRVALIGNPNCGKTTLFNRLTGLRAKTSNFPGTTLECRTGRIAADDGHKPIDLIDLPGLYSTNFALSEEQVAVGALRGQLPGLEPPDAVVVVIDATCLSRHLYLASEVRQLGLPMLVALNMMDEARQQGLTICLDTLSRELDATVIPVCGRSGEGIDKLRAALTKLANDPTHEQRRALQMSQRLAACSCSACPHTNRHTWACGVSAMAGIAQHDPGISPDPSTDRVDRLLTHPLLGIAAFAAIMTGLFILIFMVAAYPMDWIDLGFTWLGDTVAAHLPDNLWSSFLVDGVIGGVGGVVIFLPQICLLFFALTLLEDTGYLARAAFVADRIMRAVGLPGKAFIPLLSAHACAIPAIMATKVLESRRDRIITILVLPLMTCSARLPVYAMVTALLFSGSAVKSGLVFFFAYSLGGISAMCASFILGKTVLKGTPQHLVIELPPYRLPSLRTALLSAYDRAVVFLSKAGGIILLISVGLWTAATFPTLPPEQLASVASPADAAILAQPDVPADTVEAMHARYALEHSLAGRVGRFVEPVFKPLGFDWRIDIGVMTSFAAREVIVSTLAIVAGIGEGGADNQATLIDSLHDMHRPDGSPLFTTATSLSLLVFFVLAMQCLPTQVVTRRETGSWKWAALQFGYMTVLAYVAAMVTFQLVSAIT